MTDLEVTNHGSIVTLRPLTEAGTAWMDQNLAPEPWQWLGGALAIETRYAPDIVDGAIADGLRVDPS